MYTTPHLHDRKHTATAVHLHHHAVGTLLLALQHLVVRHVLLVRGDLTDHEQQARCEGAHNDEQRDDQPQQRGGVVQGLLAGLLGAVAARVACAHTNTAGENMSAARVARQCER
jgi:hypothetical protein